MLKVATVSDWKDYLIFYSGLAIKKCTMFREASKHGVTAGFLATSD